jgi:uncharacterized Zn finger protein (UPF0148 family)
MPLLLSLAALVLAALALLRSGRDTNVRSCPNCHAPLGAGQIDCPVCTRR